MLIMFSPTEQELNQALPSHIVYLVVELLRADRKGNHIIVIPRITCQWLRETLDLSQIDRAHLRRLESRFTQLGGLYKQAAIFTTVYLNFDSEFKFEGKQLQISMRLLLEGNLLDPPVFLVEDSVSDGGFYGWILKEVSNRTGISYLKFELHNGGGSRIYDLFSLLSG